MSEPKRHRTVRLGFRLASLLLGLLVSYIVAEAWARYRFDVNNPLMPSHMRNNIGLHPLDAYRLKPDFEGFSRSGLHYKTDAHGFRIGRDVRPDGFPLLLGGDSRAFGYALPYEDSVAGKLEADESFKKLRVYQQAFPGGSPAIFNVQMWEEGLWDRLRPQPKVVVYAYDRDDVWNDRSFLLEYERIKGKTWSTRHLKCAMGGYLWNMLNLKKKSFWAKYDVEPLWWKDSKTSTPSSMESKVPSTPKLPQVQVQKAAIAEGSLLELQKQCAERGVPFVLVHLPRFVELIGRQSSVSDTLERFCHQHGINFINLYRYMDSMAQSLPEKADVGTTTTFEHGFGPRADLIFSWFLDPKEGIHYSSQGSLLVAEEIAKKLAQMQEDSN